jgi:DEAD/DEAH box helicase domain-containing protein
MLELSTGEQLTVSRSLPTTAKWMETAASALKESEVTQIGGIPFITRSSKSVMLCHPLWRLDPSYFTDLQAEAFDEARDRFETVQMEDIRSFRRNPLIVWPHLQ